MTVHLNVAYNETLEYFLNIHFKGIFSTDKINREVVSQFVEWRYNYRKPNCSRKDEVSDATIQEEVAELRRCLENPGRFKLY